MRGPLVALTLLWLASCSEPPPPQVVVDEVSPIPEADAEVGAGGAGVEVGQSRLTGLPGIDDAQDLEVRILDSRGTGRLGGVGIPPGQPSPVVPGRWLLSDSGSEFEITVRGPLLPDGIVRLEGRSAFLVERPVGGPIPRFRVFGGQASFYLPRLPQDDLQVLTPAGPLISRGAVFSVTVSPDFRVLVTCREGAVYLTGTQNAVAIPGQVLIADGQGRGRTYAMTPNEAQVFAGHWLQIETEEAAPGLAADLAPNLVAWKAAESLGNQEKARFLALWFREAHAILGDQVPGPEVWGSALGTEVRSSVWALVPRNPGLLGGLP